jgi:tripartite ATP-independent transporter DctP family solute receptor
MSRRGASRREFLGAAAALPFGLLSACGERGATRLHYASNLNADHPLTHAMVSAAAQIAEDTGGGLELRVFPNSQLGSEFEMLTQLRAGAIELYSMSGIVLSSLVPIAAINGVGFAFHEEAEVWRTMDGPLGTLVRGEIERRGMFVFKRMWNGGFRQVTSGRQPVLAPDDLYGFKIRVPGSRLWTSTFTALGAAPANIPFGEVYASLQTHVVDGQETPLISIEAAKLYEVQRHCSLTNHMWDGFWMLANAQAWQRLPERWREIVRHRLDEATLAQRADVAARNAVLRGVLEGRGLRFHAVEVAAFRDTLRRAGFYGEWRTRFGEPAWALLQAGAGRELA